MVKGPAWLAKLETLSLLYVSVFLTRIGFGVIIIIFPVYLAAGPFLASLVVALYPAVEGVSALPVGAYVDRRGRRRAFVIGMALISVLTFVVGLTNNISIVGGAHGIMGLAAAMITVSSLTMITDLTVEENRGAGMGAFNMANLAGYGLGIVLGTVFSAIFNLELGYSFFIVAGIFGAATGFVYFALREPGHVPQRQRSLKEMYDNLTGEVAAIFPIWFSITMVVGFYLFLPKLVSDANAKISQSAPLILAGLVVLGVGAVLFGRLSDKIGRTRTMLIGAVGEVGFLALFPSFFQKIIVIPPGAPLLESYNEIGPIILVAGFFFFLGSALLPSVLAYVGDKAANDFRGSSMGFYSLMLSAGIGLGTILAGITDELAGVQGVFLTATIIFLGLSLTSGLLLHQQNHRPRPPGVPEIRQGKPI